MGCSGTKDENPSKINHEMVQTNVPKVDEFFSLASGVLEKSEKIRSGLSDSLKENSEICKVNYLKNGHTLKDGLQVWLWSVAANNEGSLQNSGIKLEKEPPYCVANLDNCPEECKKFQENLKTFLETLFTSGPKLEEILKDVKQLGDQSKELSKNLKQECTSAGLTSSQYMTAVKNFTKNSTTLKNGITKIQTVQQSITQSAIEFTNLMPKLEEIYKQADETGKKCLEENLKTPAQCFKYHTGLKLTDEQYNKKHCRNENKNQCKSKQAQSGQNQEQQQSCQEQQQVQQDQQEQQNQEVQEEKQKQEQEQEAGQE